MHGLSEQELMALSADERALVEGLTDDPEMAAALGVEVAADEDDGDLPQQAQAAQQADEQPMDDEPPADEDAQAGEAPAAGQQSEEPEPAPEQVPEQVQAAQEPVPTAVSPQKLAPDDIGQQRADLRQQKALALAKLMEGEIDAAEYARIEGEVDDKLGELARAQAIDEARVQLSRDALLREYSSALQGALAQVKAAGLTDVDAPGSAVGQAFDRAVRMFGGDAAARGLVDVPGNLAASNDALAEAVAYVLRRYGKAVPAPAPVAQAQAASPAVKPRAPLDRSKLPPSLAAIPAAADATVGAADEFSHLADLDASALERAVARMTPEQLERYLAS